MRNAVIEIFLGGAFNHDMNYIVLDLRHPHLFRLPRICAVNGHTTESEVSHC